MFGHLINDRLSNARVQRFSWEKRTATEGYYGPALTDVTTGGLITNKESKRINNQVCCYSHLLLFKGVLSVWLWQIESALTCSRLPHVPGLIGSKKSFYWQNLQHQRPCVAIILLYGFVLSPLHPYRKRLPSWHKMGHWGISPQASPARSGKVCI